MVGGRGIVGGGAEGGDGGGGCGLEVVVELEVGRAGVERLDYAHAPVPAEGFFVGGFTYGEVGLLAVVGDQNVV